MVKQIKRQHNKVQEYEREINKSQINETHRENYNKCYYCKLRYKSNVGNILLGHKVCEFCFQEGNMVLFADGTYSVEDSPFYIKDRKLMYRADRDV